MIHYHVWFNLRAGSQEAESLAVIHTFVKEVQARGSPASVRLLANQGREPRTKLPKFHALFEFASDEQFSAAFSAQAAQGIRTGFHGRVMSLVDEFQIEVFRELMLGDLPWSDEPAYLHACEI